MASGVYKLLNPTIYRSFPVNQEQMAGRIIWIDRWNCFALDGFSVYWTTYRH